MNVRQDDKREKYSNLPATFGRIIAFAVVAFTVCGFVKSVACGQGCDSCPCGNDGASNCCSDQGEPAEAD